MRVLVVDDDRAVRETVMIGLRGAGHEALGAADGRTALQAIAEDEPGLVILDLGLPDLSGVDVLRELRQRSGLPVIVLSARHDGEDKVEALDLGADDYVTKPFGMAELLARVRAAARRTDLPREVVTNTRFTVDPVAGQVTVDGSLVRLTPIEWKLLLALISRPGRLVSQATLLAEVWGPAYESETQYLRVHIGNLRHKLEADHSRPRYLITEPGMGYRYVP